MTTPPAPPPPPPYAAGPAGPAGLDPRRPRPSGWWFALGGALLLGAVAAGVGLLVWTLSSFMETDATVPADGTAHPVAVGTDGDRVLWFPAGVPVSCDVVDTGVDPAGGTGGGTGGEVPLEPVTGTFEKSDGDGDWFAARRFDPGSGELDVTCTSPGATPDVQVGPAPDIGGFLGSIALTIGVPLALGLAGLVVLVVTGVRWAAGRPRD